MLKHVLSGVNGQFCVLKLEGDVVLGRFVQEGDDVALEGGDADRCVLAVGDDVVGALVAARSARHGARAGDPEDAAGEEDTAESDLGIRVNMCAFEAKKEASRVLQDRPMAAVVFKQLFHVREI